MRRVISLASAALLFVGCGGIGPGFTIPPISHPNSPAWRVPSAVRIPSGLLPSVPAGSGTCAFVTPAEVQAIFGSTVTDTSNSGAECSLTFANFSTISISTESGSDLQTSRFLFGDTAKDVSVAGLPGLTGVFIGQPAVHVQRGGDQMQVLGILTGSDDATIARLVQVATIAVSRWPA